MRQLGWRDDPDGGGFGAVITEEERLEFMRVANVQKERTRLRLNIPPTLAKGDPLRSVSEEAAGVFRDTDTETSSSDDDS